MLGNNVNFVYDILMSSDLRTVACFVGRTGLGQPVLSRALNKIAQHTGRLATHRQGRSIVYAITRSVRSLPHAIPVHDVSPEGSASLMGTLTSLEGCGYLVVAANGRS